MNSFAEKLKFWSKDDDDASSGAEIYDRDASALSPIGHAVHDVLRKRYNRSHRKMWNVTTGTIVDEVQATPRHLDKGDPSEGHSDWFPQKMEEMISKTEAWCDIASLGPPDGRFMECFRRGLQKLAQKSQGKENKVVVRMMFGNIAGMPVNCAKVVKDLTLGLDPSANLRLWVGAWRKGFSWNHSKLIAVDGLFLHTGGHNLWDRHYLTNNPVHDLSVEFEGRVARDGHRYANVQWDFVERKQKTCVGGMIDRMPDRLPMATKSRVTVSEWPEGVASVFPPRWSPHIVGMEGRQRIVERDVPLISIGRQGALDKAKPSDDAILAMIDSSQKIIRMTLQDFGPVCVPGTKKALPGLKWPKDYLTALGKAIYERGVDVEIVLSNPNSVPGGLKGTEANYGNGWDCVDVAAEIVKRIQKNYGAAVDDAKLRAMIAENLRICFVRHGKESEYADGKTIGLHSKHFVVDDACCYIGSQNLYMCDLAEWGVVIDSEEEVRKILRDYFAPMWESSFTGEDVDVQKVMDGLNVDRDGEKKMWSGVRDNRAAMALMPHGGGNYYDYAEEEKETAVEVADGEAPVVVKNDSDEPTAEEALKDGSEAARSAAAESEAAPSSAAGQPTSEQGDASSSPEKKEENSSSKNDSGEGSSSTPQKHVEEKNDDVASLAQDPSADNSHWDQQEYTKTESQEQIEKAQLDCNWCGMGEALMKITKQ